MSITKEQLNNHYEQLNNLVDDYIDNWKIKPSNLKRYLKPGSKRFKNFLLRNDLTESYHEVILKDIIEDRVSMEKDGVLTFESFSLNESNDLKIESMEDVLYKGIEKSDITMEKVLADYFDTNLSSISIEDSFKHIFKVDGWSGDKKVIIYSKEDFDLISENIFEKLYEKLSNSSVDLIEDVSINLSELIDNELFLNKIKSKLSQDFIKQTISKLSGLTFEAEVMDHFIWTE